MQRIFMDFQYNNLIMNPTQMCLQSRKQDKLKNRFLIQISDAIL